jgi:ribokinase
MSVAISDASGDYGAVIVSGANLLVDSTAFTEPDLWQGARTLILQNEMPDTINISAARAAKTAGATVCLNAAPYRPLPGELAALVDLLVVNAIEAEELGGLTVTDLASAGLAAEALAKQFPVVVVTAGGEGVAGMRRGEDLVVLPALPVTLVSTHGAGDAFVGALVTALAAGHSFAECLRSANAAAAAHVSTRTDDS